MAEESYTVVASSPHDIILEFVMKDASGQDAAVAIPLKNISFSHTIDHNLEYGTGSHLPYADTVGKITPGEGNFTIGTWWVSSESNPSTWDALVRNYLTYSNDEGLPKEFEIRVHARPGASMVSQGTGTYGTGSTSSGVDSMSDKMVIQKYLRCKLKGTGLDIPEGSTVTRKYDFTCLRTDPL